MTWQDLFTTCREANQLLGIVAFVCLGYRAAIGLYDRIIIYRPMFLIFVGYVFVSAIGAPIGIAVGNKATFLSLLLTALHLSLIVVCLFVPGPLRRTKEGRTT